MTIPAFTYARFSTAEQSEGDSLERQLRGARQFIEAQGWQYAADREMVDAGLSAFHGRNRDTGSKLHEFEKKALDGHFDNGAVLVVENLDRITRQGFEDAFDLVRRFNRHGVTVATWTDGQIYRAGERFDMGKAMLLIAKAEIAHEESRKKSGRLRSAWATKRKQLAEGNPQALTRVMPGWLDKDAKTGQPVAIPHRAKVLNEIFDWYCDGKGLPWIVRTLNDRKEPTWGKGKQQQNKGWSVSTVHKYLTNRAAVGEYVPGSRAEDGSTKRKTDLMIPNYFPQVITAEKFNRAQAVRAGRKGWGGKNQFALPNLFSGIATCYHCGGKVHMVAQNKKGMPRTHTDPKGVTRTYTQKVTRSYLRCDNARRAFGCDNNRGVHYEPLEQNILTAMFDMAMHGITFDANPRVDALVERIAEQERLLGIKANQLETITANLLDVRSKALAAKLADIEAEIEQEQETLADLKRSLELEQGSGLPVEHLDRLVEARTALESEDEELRYAARVKTQQALKSLITDMACDRNGDTHINVDRQMYFLIPAEGEMRQMIWAGPEGEIDWHPDEEAA